MYFLRIMFYVLVLNGIINAQNYYQQSEFSLTSPGAMRYGLYGSDNPALLTTVTGPDLLFTWSDQNGWKSINKWGVYAAVPYLGFSLNREKAGGFGVTDYKLSFGFGNQTFGFGMGYGWSGGDENIFGRTDVFTAGTFGRIKYLSVGVIGNFIAHRNNEGIIDIAIRPFGNELLSLFADYVFRKSESSDRGFIDPLSERINRSRLDRLDSQFSVGAALELLPGIRITGRYFENDLIRTGIEYSLGHIGLSTQANFSKDEYLYNTYGIRIGSYDRNLVRHLQKNNSFVDINLQGNLKYQRFRFLDNSNTLLDMLNYIKSTKEDKAAAGIVLNLSGMQINREMIWELRSELENLKSVGKKIYIYIDRVDINGYYLASAADKIIMDPIGNIILEGYIAGKTYFAGTLEKIGIGFNELRYFKYKSAYETFSREEMSAADEEQYQRITDNFYETARKDISSSRKFTHAFFDSLVNNVPFFLSEDAVKLGLVDTLSRWDKIKDLVNKYEGDDKKFISPSFLAKYRNPRDDYWGEKPKIAVIYALGICAMDEGINARELVKKVESALKNPGIKAIVFRVDSPGGDALASDLIAEKFGEYKYQKPVIVSQGNVAASGGYWLSMYGDTIVAAPGTLTGSIGVIGAWVYNKDFKEKIGVTTDFVKRGAHADLPFGMTIPLIGLRLPDRNLNDIEEKKIRSGIESMYKDFVNKVSSGRDMNYNEVDSVAQGRVWSGADGKDIGLIDVLGNLNTAIEIAVKKAGIKNNEYEIVEMPEPGFIDFNLFMPQFFGLKIDTEDPVIQNLRFRIQNSGYPMPMMPIEFPDGVIMK